MKSTQNLRRPWWWRGNGPARPSGRKREEHGDQHDTRAPGPPATVGVSLKLTELRGLSMHGLSSSEPGAESQARVECGEAQCPPAPGRGSGFGAASCLATLGQVAAVFITRSEPQTPSPRRRRSFGTALVAWGGHVKSPGS